MTYKLILSPKALQHFDEWSRSGNTSAIRKIYQMLEELATHPTTGTGKPEKLRGNLQGYWSRRITKADRLVYRIDGNEIVVYAISLKGHYGDK